MSVIGNAREPVSDVFALPPPLPAGDLWVFGYGSLLWRPGFAYQTVRPARLFGYHRALCVWSWVHRGTRERPGLVFGLDLGGSCVGRVYRVAEREKPAVAAYLYGREMATPVYLPKLRKVYSGGKPITALTFIVDRGHPQYARRLSLETQLRVVIDARGQSGVNRDYVINTVEHLQQLGIREPSLEALRDRLLQPPVVTA